MNDLLKKLLSRFTFLTLRAEDGGEGEEAPATEDEPEGESDADNMEVKKWGEIPKFDFKPKPNNWSLSL